jgi:acetyl esterase
MMHHHVLTILVACFVALIAYINNQKGELEPLPFFLSKLTLLILPPQFPANTTASAHMFRKLYAIGFISAEPAPKMPSTDIYIDDVVHGEKRLIRIFNPSNDSEIKSSAARDVLLFYFAGAWMLGNVDDNDKLCKTLAAQTGFIVVCVEYSLAPEHPFPRGFHDSVAALRWVKRNIAQYGGNPDRVFLSGESAGGNLAAALTAYNYDPHYTCAEDKVSLLGLLLVYPPTAANFSTESYVKYARFNGMLPASEMIHAWSMYSGGAKVYDFDYRYQPLYASSALFAQFPPTIVVVAEYDVLRDDALMFAARLVAANVSVDVTVYPTIHGFFGRDVTALGSKAVAEATAKLRHLSASSIPV